MRQFVVLIALAMSAGVARAQVEVHQAWARSTVPGQTVGAAYMEIHSSERVKLMKATSPVAKSVALHETKVEGGVMKMREAPAVEIPAGGSLVLKPGGYHLMLMQLVKPLKAGDVVPITLVFEGPGSAATSISVSAEVRDVAKGSDHNAMH